MDNEHDKLNDIRWTQPLRPCAPLLEAGLLSMPDFMNGSPGNCEMFLSTSSASIPQAARVGARYSQVLCAHNVAGHLVRYKPAAHPVFGPLKHKYFPRGPGRDFLSSL